MIPNVRKRFKTLLISFIALLVIIWLEIFLQKKQYFIGGGINRVFLFLLINFHIIVIIVLFYLIVRNTIKLFVELSRKKPGSNFKKNLLVAFSVFSIIPAVLIFFIFGKLITTSINDWFSARIRMSLKQTLDLHKNHTIDIRKNLEKVGKKLSEKLNQELNGDKQNFSVKINKFIKQDSIFKKYKVYLWKDCGKECFGSLSDEANIWRKFRRLNDRSVKSLKKRFFSNFKSLDKFYKIFDFYGSLYFVKNINLKVDEKIFKNLYLVIVYRYNDAIRYPLIYIQNAIFDYDQLRLIRNPIYYNYFFTLILITLLILFLAIWCAFYLAKGISKPIEDLLKATEKVRKGFFDVEVGFESSSDLKNLVLGFNQMTKVLKHTRTQLEQKNKEMMMILENIKEAVFFVNKFGRILTYNMASKELVEKYLGLSRFKNKKINFFGNNITERFFTLIRQLKKEEKTSITKELVFSFNSEIKTLLVHMTFIDYFERVLNFKKPQRGLLILIEDLTDIVKVNKMKTWQEAAKQMAHEIKNPLTPIQLATQRLQRKFHQVLNDDKIFLECTGTILNHVKIIKDLVTHFSEFAKMPTSNIESLDINKVIKEVVCLYEHSYPDIKFIYELGEFIPLVKIDKKNIKRVIVNLLDNSIRILKNMTIRSDEDKLILGMNDKRFIKIKTSFKTGLNQIELLICDNGPGIPPNVKDKLFLPYVSGEKKNMGLGLAIVYEIIKQLGGSIKLLPSKEGAVFQILLNI
ncbi:hypothetical protein KAT08_00785 [Candidatus Babeliales bacterium]|nr:hypothetical protein [Candidatus Babeliales bacterium]